MDSAKFSEIAKNSNLISQSGNIREMNFRIIKKRIHTKFYENVKINSPEKMEKTLNIPKRIFEKTKNPLHKNRSSPIGILKEKIEEFFTKNFVTENNQNVVHSKLHVFKKFDKFSPKVNTLQNFDSLLIPESHPSRGLTESFYYDKNNLLRTQMTCHDVDLMKLGHDAFIVTGDCYRKDTIDRSHFPIFHQMDGVRLFDKKNVSPNYVIDDLKTTLTRLVKFLFENKKMRWNKDYFPFTNPSFELEIENGDNWLEILGCGVLHPKVLENANRNDKVGWAFGIGLERIAMALFEIPDIRLFHSNDTRFTNQFVNGEITKFRPFSKFPACYKDISFWIEDGFSENEFSSVIREVAGDLVESIELIDNYSDHVTGRSSRCYRISYRSFSRSLTNDEVDLLQENVVKKLSQMGTMEIR